MKKREKKRRNGIRLHGMPAEEFRFMKELNDYQEGPSELIRVLGLVPNTIPLRSAERGTSILARGYTSKASDTDLTVPVGRYGYEEYLQLH